MSEPKFQLSPYFKAKVIEFTNDMWLRAYLHESKMSEKIEAAIAKLIFTMDLVDERDRDTDIDLRQDPRRSLLDIDTGGEITLDENRALTVTAALINAEEEIIEDVNAQMNIAATGKHKKDVTYMLTNLLLNAGEERAKTDPNARKPLLKPDHFSTSLG